MPAAAQGRQGAACREGGHAAAPVGGGPHCRAARPAGCAAGAVLRASCPAQRPGRPPASAGAPACRPGRWTPCQPRPAARPSRLQGVQIGSAGLCSLQERAPEALAGRGMLEQCTAQDPRTGFRASGGIRSCPQSQPRACGAASAAAERAGSAETPLGCVCPARQRRSPVLASQRSRCPGEPVQRPSGLQPLCQGTELVPEPHLHCLIAPSAGQACTEQPPASGRQSQHRQPHKRSTRACTTHVAPSLGTRAAQRLLGARRQSTAPDHAAGLTDTSGRPNKRRARSLEADQLGRALRCLLHAQVRELANRRS